MRFVSVLAVCGLAGVVACSRGDDGRANTNARPSATPTATADEAHAALDRLDARTPVPLLPMMANHQKENMRDHLVAVQEIVTALGASDFAKIEAASARIGDSEQMGGMCRHMGAGAPGFTDQALDFHHKGDRIGDAARRRDVSAVLGALGDTLAACTSCHAVYKQAITNELPPADDAP